MPIQEKVTLDKGERVWLHYREARSIPFVIQTWEEVDKEE
jgi:hypothetical protein